MKPNKNHSAIMLPECAYGTAGFTDKDTLELYVTDGVIMFIKDKMTALEVANTIESLSTLASDLIVALATGCGICDNCGMKMKPIVPTATSTKTVQPSGCQTVLFVMIS